MERPTQTHLWAAPARSRSRRLNFAAGLTHFRACGLTEATGSKWATRASRSHLPAARSEVYGLCIHTCISTSIHGIRYTQYTRYSSGIQCVLGGLHRITARGSRRQFSSSPGCGLMNHVHDLWLMAKPVARTSSDCSDCPDTCLPKHAGDVKLLCPRPITTAVPPTHTNANIDSLVGQNGVARLTQP
jgi:hypothetical protein